MGLRSILGSLLLGACAYSQGSAAPLRIHSADLPPYSHQDHGAGTGLVHDIVTAMAERTGFKGKIEFVPWNRAIQLTTDKSDFLVLPVARSPEREHAFTWIVPIVTVEFVLVGLKGSTADIDSLAGARQLRVGTLQSSPLNAYLAAHDFTRLDKTHSMGLNAHKLARGRIDAWLTPFSMATFIYQREGYDSTELRKGVTVLQTQLYLAGAKSIDARTVAQWRQAYAAIAKDGTLKKIQDKYQQTQ